MFLNHSTTYFIRKIYDTRQTRLIRPGVQLDAVFLGVSSIATRQTTIDRVTNTYYSCDLHQSSTSKVVVIIQPFVNKVHDRASLYNSNSFGKSTLSQGVIFT